MRVRVNKIIFICVYIFFVSISSVFSISVKLELEGGIIYAPVMSGQILEYEDNRNTAQMTVSAMNVITPDFRTILDFNWKYVGFEISGEYSSIYHDLRFNVNAKRDKCTYYVYGYINRTYFDGLDSKENEYSVEEFTSGIGAKIAFNTEVIRNRVLAGASAYIELQPVNNMRMTPYDSSYLTYSTESKRHCFAVGFDGKVSFFKVVTIGASMTSWQFRDTDSGTFIGSFVPIQIRNVFYGQIYHSIGKHFAVDFSIDYFCDHPEITWNSSKGITRSNQSYFMGRCLGVFKL